MAKRRGSSGNPFLPSGAELAGYLARAGATPSPRSTTSCASSQYVGAARGEDELYLYLREVFASEYPPTSLHRLLARSARSWPRRVCRSCWSVTTNYDDLVERALAERGPRVRRRLVRGEAERRSRADGSCIGRPAGKPTVITRPNKYTGLPIALERPVILKLHGCLDRESASDDSYVITEDSYIDYLSGGDVGALIPIALWQRMTSSSFLFLGYSLSDWNLRVILNRIWGARKLVGEVMGGPARAGRSER